MQCYRCSAETRSERVLFSMPVSELDEVILVKDVPAHVCPQCGEQFFDFDVAQNLEAMRELALRGKLATHPAQGVIGARYAVLS